MTRTSPIDRFAQKKRQNSGAAVLRRTLHPAEGFLGQTSVFLTNKISGSGYCWICRDRNWLGLQPGVR